MILSRHLFACVMSALTLWSPAVARAGDWEDAQSALQRKAYATAARLLQPLAVSGHAQAQLRLGLLHLNGQGVPENNGLAEQWLERAARLGLAEAQFHLANMHAFGLSRVPHNEDAARLAAQWYFAAARQGHAEAQYTLGILFLSGSGVLASQAEAHKWMARAAAQGHPDAQAYLRAAPP